MIFSSPPQFGQSAMSISKTRLSRLAQLNRTGRWCEQVASHPCRRCGRHGWFGLLRHHLRHHQRAQLGVGCQNAMEANQVQPRSGHQRSQPLHELQRRHHQVRGADAPSGLELEHDLPGGVGLHALVGQSRKAGA